MDLTYSPGELESKITPISGGSAIKREHDSVDDFEHLEPDSSPVEPSKPLVEAQKLDVNSDNASEQFSIKSHDSFDPLTSSHSLPHPTQSFAGKEEKFDQEFAFSAKNKIGDFETGNEEISSFQTGLKNNDSVDAHFISAEKTSNSTGKTDLVSDLLDLDNSSSTDLVKDIVDLHNKDNRLAKDNEADLSDCDTLTKPLKEADALPQYELKFEHKESVKPLKDDNMMLDREYDSESQLRNEAGSVPDYIIEDLKKHGFDAEEASKHYIAICPSKPDSEPHHSGSGEESEDESMKANLGSDSLEKTADSLEVDLNKSESPTVDDPVKEQKSPHIEPRDVSSEEDILKPRICICPSKPNTAVSDLDDIIGPEDVFKRIGLDAWFTPGRLHPKVEALVYWRDPKKSGVVFGGVMAILIALCNMSLISVIAYASMITLTGTICFRIYKSIMQAVQKTNDGHPFKEILELELTLPQDKVREVTDTAVVHFNAAVIELRRLFLVEDLIDSIKFGVCLWCLTFVGAIFNGMTLVILAFVALFTVPKIYENNKASIDTYIEMGRSKVAEITSKVKAALPIGKKEPEKNKEQ